MMAPAISALDSWWVLGPKMSMTGVKITNTGKYAIRISFCLLLYLKPSLSPFFVLVACERTTGARSWRNVPMLRSAPKVFHRARGDEPQDTDSDKGSEVFERRQKGKSMGEPIHCRNSAVHQQPS